MSREKINALYYPDMYVDQTTLKKAILLFDEIHFMDRPSFTFKNNFGTIGASSPLRQYEQSFRDAGVPLFVHGVQGGRVSGDFFEQVEADISDSLFLIRFQDGLRSSPTFRGFHVPPGNYGAAGDENDVLHKITNVDISSIVTGKAEELFLDEKIKPYELSTLDGCIKQLIRIINKGCYNRIVEWF